MVSEVVESRSVRYSECDVTKELYDADNDTDAMNESEEKSTTVVSSLRPLQEYHGQ